MFWRSWWIILLCLLLLDPPLHSRATRLYLHSLHFHWIHDGKSSHCNRRTVLVKRKVPTNKLHITKKQKFFKCLNRYFQGKNTYFLFTRKLSKHVATFRFEYFIWSCIYWRQETMSQFFKTIEFFLAPLPKKQTKRLTIASQWKSKNKLSDCVSAMASRQRKSLSSQSLHSVVCSIHARVKMVIPKAENLERIIELLKTGWTSICRCVRRVWWYL